MAHPPNVTARVLSLNVAQVVRFPYRGHQVPTGIYKVPVIGPVAVGTLGVAGDTIADLRVHGGPRKAVYAYPSEHYAFWRDLHPGREMPWGWLGENLTTVGLDETTVRVGDRLRIGSALLAVTQPREPCYKLAHKFGTPAVVKQMWESGRCGFYLAVLEPGELSAGDAIETVQRAEDAMTIADVFRAKGAE